MIESYIQLSLDINEYEIDNFIVDNQAELLELKGYGWPIDYQNQEELKTFLMDNGYCMAISSEKIQKTMGRN